MASEASHVYYVSVSPGNVPRSFVTTGEVTVKHFFHGVAPNKPLAWPNTTLFRLLNDITLAPLQVDLAPSKKPFEKYENLPFLKREKSSFFLLNFCGFETRFFREKNVKKGWLSKTTLRDQVDLNFSLQYIFY